MDTSAISDFHSVGMSVYHHSFWPLMSYQKSMSGAREIGVF